MRWTGRLGREKTDMGKEIGKEESHERHLKERGRVNLTLSGRVWWTNPYCKSKPLNPSRSLSTLTASPTPGPAQPGLSSSFAVAWRCIDEHTYLQRKQNADNQAKKVSRLQCLSLCSRNPFSSSWSVSSLSFILLTLIDPYPQPLPPVSASDETFGSISSSL